MSQNNRVQDLLDRYYSDRDLKAFHALFDIFKDRVWVYILMKYPRLEQDKDDILQDVSIDLSSLLIRKRYEADHFYALLYTVIKRRTYDHLRQMGSGKNVIGAAEELNEHFQKSPTINDDVSFLSRLLNKIDLPADQKEVMMAHDLHGSSIEDIADHLQISAWTVRSRLRLAREKIKAYLKEATGPK